MIKKLFILVISVSAIFCSVLYAEMVILKTGDTVEGEIVRTVGSNVTIRTSSGISQYHIQELDQKWVDEHYDKIYTEIRQKRVDEVKGIIALAKGLVGKESLAKATPFLKDYRKYVLPISAGLVAFGLAMCFFGWKLFKFTTILGGIITGIIFGLMLGGMIAMGINQILPEDIQKWGTIAVFLFSGVPLAIFGAKIGRRFAMFGARINSLGGVGSGWVMSIFSVTQFAFFDLSVIWGNALFGAISISVGAYCGAVLLLEITDERLQIALLGSVVAAVAFCIFGAISQINGLRSEPQNGSQGDY